jgi:hypothetical protein
MYRIFLRDSLLEVHEYAEDLPNILITVAQRRVSFGIRPVLRIRDVYPGSEFFPSRFRIKEFKYFEPKKVLGNMIRVVHPGSGSRIRIPDPFFYPSRIPDPGVKKAPDPGSATRHHTVQYYATPKQHFLPKHSS